MDRVSNEKAFNEAKAQDQINSSMKSTKHLIQIRINIFPSQNLSKN